ncbi:hypothetical protein NE619_11015 [Anaerovorax odorimutans]|uniref:Uncharacterized protein n=1 Tax=Anaerovorax odorimutans TaxID=109327 RepID=A0ABT1RQ16_9FIRM|nr:hypothetical protein [Anaerovorax odorimutans]MCQ4637253.1 hypothetical protein [Anaerovorax odorimutans]
MCGQSPDLPGTARCAKSTVELEFEVPEIYLLGDAKKVANIMYGIWDAFEVASLRRFLL